ncbi:hypothetical protein [Auritidibacter sp. NML100628]|uniref:YkvI family membrane protein n=1 Tax=Auritidibacter sp. NML100628 TaxID=2170742 RepID=UPI000D7274D9|nr:hypothetical protein [Auritidibacter sp. NML100628]PXA77016.1 hypothetical protein DCC24_05285 [Auritidibacter sp. NML100628]
MTQRRSSQTPQTNTPGTAATSGPPTDSGGGFAWGAWVRNTGAITAVVIGSGFATGQEILQFFAFHGLWGIIGTGAVVCVILGFVAAQLARAGYHQRFARPGQAYEFFAGRWLGLAFEWFALLFMFAVTIIMIAGADSLFVESFGWSPHVMGVIMTVLLVATVLMGLRRTVDIVGNIGPVIAVIAILLGIYGIAHNPSGIADSARFLADVDFEANEYGAVRAGSNWLVAGLLFASYNMLVLVNFVTAVGTESPQRKVAVASGASGGVLFALGAAVAGAGLLANLPQVWDKDIPMLEIAGLIAPWAQIIVAILIVFGVYTTAVPLLWSTVNQFAEDRTPRAVVLTLVFAGLAMTFALFFDFRTLVNSIYTIGGWVGLIFMLILVAQTLVVQPIRNRRQKQHAQA